MGGQDSQVEVELINGPNELAHYAVVNFFIFLHITRGVTAQVCPHEDLPLHVCMQYALKCFFGMIMQFSN
jgi:hypothetical protein